MLDRNAPPLVKLNPGVQAPDSLFDTGSSNWNYLKRLSFCETGAPRVNQLMPIINPLDTEAMSNLSNSLCPVAKVKSLEDVSLSEPGYPLPNSQGEQANISNNVESGNPAKKSKFCSGAPQQSQNTMATEKVRDRKATRRMHTTKVTEAIKALNSALPCPKTGNRISILDNVIDYIKFLQHQLKVLSQTRLNGEASAQSFVHIEGSGHYLLHPQACHQPLEEIVGHLLTSNLEIADGLLEYKGLAIVPMDFAFAIFENSKSSCSNSCQQ